MLTPAPLEPRARPVTDALGPLSPLDELDEVAIFEVAERNEAELVAALAAARAEAAAAAAEIARLQERVKTLESWVAAAARRRKIEYLQAQRLALMHALERDERYTFVLSLPTVLLVLYCAGLGVLIWFLLAGPV